MTQSWRERIHAGYGQKRYYRFRKARNPNPMRVARIAICAFILGLSPAGATGDMQTRVIGGKDAPASEWPWMVAVLEDAVDNDFQAQFCGGMLISPEWILSAAHCFEPGDDDTSGSTSFSASQISVLIDTVALCNDCQGDRREINQIKIPDGSEGPNWDTSTEANIDDIALLRLENPVSVPTASVIDATRSATLPDSGDDGIRVLGWGASEPNPEPDSDYLFPFTLQQVALDFVPLNECKRFYNRDELFSDSMLCAHEPEPDTSMGEDTCLGDSGGPLFLERDGADWVAGITSWGFDCGDAGFPGVYTAIRDYVDWLEAVTAAATAPVVDVTGALSVSSRYAETDGTLRVQAELRNGSVSNDASGVLGQLDPGGSASATDADENDELECTDNSAGLACTIGHDPLAPQTARQGSVEISHSGDGPDRISVSLTANADEGDYRSGNDRAEQTLIFSDQPDLDIRFGTPNAGSDTASVPLTVINQATHHSARDIAFTLQLPPGLSLENPEALNCNNQPWVCRPGNTLQAEQSRQYNLKLAADSPGDYNLSARADSLDGDFPDADPDARITVTFPRNQPGSDSSGGSLPIFSLALSLALYSRRKKRSMS